VAFGQAERVVASSTPLDDPARYNGRQLAEAHLAQNNSIPIYGALRRRALPSAVDRPASARNAALNVRRRWPFRL
jgi:hypothetical protein